MLSIIRETPEHVFGVRATGQVTASDLKSVLLPGLDVLTQKYGEIYYLLVLETPVENFTAGAWFQDMIAGLKHFIKWKKVAIVTDEKAVEKFTDAFSYIVPGEFKGFEMDNLDAAMAWLNKKD
jgi:hypothetical protein